MKLARMATKRHGKTPKRAPIVASRALWVHVEANPEAHSRAQLAIEHGVQIFAQVGKDRGGLAEHFLCQRDRPAQTGFEVRKVTALGQQRQNMKGVGPFERVPIRVPLVHRH